MRSSIVYNLVKVNYPNLSALRFFAATAVVISHIEQMKYIYQIENAFNLTAINNLGSDAVCFFFVLSGFLVTKSYLAKERNGTFVAGDFLIKRGRRIWPVYYLAVIVGFLFVPGIDNMESFPLFLLFLPNLAGVLHPFVFSTAHLWYLGADQQFYLMYPFLMKWLRKVLIPITVVFFILANYPASAPIINMFPFQLPLVGVIGALQYERNPDYFTKIAGSLTSRITVFGLVAYMILAGPNKIVASLIALAVIFTAIVCSSILDTRLFAWLGGISLGIYVFHPIVIATLLWSFRGEGLLYQSLVYGITFAVTIIIAALVHKAFEVTRSKNVAVPVPEKQD